MSEKEIRDQILSAFDLKEEDIKTEASCLPLVYTFEKLEQDHYTRLLENALNTHFGSSILARSRLYFDEIEIIDSHRMGQSRLSSPISHEERLQLLEEPIYVSAETTGKAKVMDPEGTD